MSGTRQHSEIAAVNSGAEGTQVRCAVVGVGYLGAFHAEKYAKAGGGELVAVVDNNMARAREIASKHRCQALEDYRDLPGKVDAVSIVTPSKTHFEVAEFLLEHGIHVLIEKPMTSTSGEADRLIELARQKGCIIQVGHLERFNEAILALRGILNAPKFIESHRIAPLNMRGADVNVVLDLMIHDIDLIQFLINSPILTVSASGAPVLTNEIDIANVRMEFENGAVANVTASRAGLKQERKMRIFQPDAYVSVDLQNKTCSVYRKGDGQMFPGIPNIKVEKKKFPKGDAIQAEIDAFIHSIATGTPSQVPGEEGKAALETAEKIIQKVNRRL